MQTINGVSLEEIHAAAELHIDELESYLLAEEQGDEDALHPEALAPYDGCLTCQIREVLYAGFKAAGLWPPERTGDV